MITNEMVEAACVAAWDPVVWASTSAVSKKNLRIRIRAALEHYEAAEAVRPKMVQVGTLVYDQERRFYEIADTDAIEQFPYGTELYAEQPK